MKRGDFKFNKYVTSKIIKLFDSNNVYLGIFKLFDCLIKFKSSNLDIIEIFLENDGFSICKLDNYNKFKNLENKKKREIILKKKNIKKIKEIKLHLFTSENDYNHKFKLAKNFLIKNFRLKISLIIKGREAVKSYLISEKIKKIIFDIGKFGKLTNNPNFLKKNIFLNFSPN